MAIGKAANGTMPATMASGTSNAKIDFPTARLPINNNRVVPLGIETFQL